MEATMEELDVALIDAFDVEPEREIAAPAATATKPPAHGYSFSAREPTRPTMQSAVIQYPSFDSIAPAAKAPAPLYTPPAPQFTGPSISYPSLGSPTTIRSTRSVPHTSTLTHNPVEAAPTVHHQSVIQPTINDDDEDREYQRQLLEEELAKFQRQNDYLALALAGDTPHQIEMRRQREQERKEREERRLAAMESRMEHMIQREQEREERQEERRHRYVERAHRSSTDPSPERASSTSPQSSPRLTLRSDQA